MQSNSLTALAIEIIDRHGSFALNEASKYILENNGCEGLISKALKYYAKMIFPRVLPIFPALIELSCGSVGGKPNETNQIATAMLLITASGDIHDDIIDRSTHKFQRKTLFGKYGKDITLLAGDALLMQGMELLQNSLELFQPKQRNQISKLMTKAMYEITEAEAIETQLWKKINVRPKEYFEVINHKATVAELHCKIGGIIGDADEVALECISRYGRTIGLLSTMKDEFLDLENFDEFTDRVIYEMPPYPVICAFQNEDIKNQFIPVMNRDKLSKNDVASIAQAVLTSVEVKTLKVKLRQMAEKELLYNYLLKDSKMGKEAAIILEALAIEL